MSDWDEELAKSHIAKGVKVSALTAKALAIGVALLLKKLITREKSGQRTLAQMNRMGGKLISSELKGSDLEVMDQIAKRYKVAFAAMENADGKSYTLFFKAQSEHQMVTALKAYLAETLKREKEMPERKEPLDDRMERAAAQTREQSAEHRAEKTLERTMEKELSR